MWKTRSPRESCWGNNARRAWLRLHRHPLHRPNSGASSWRLEMTWARRGAAAVGPTTAESRVIESHQNLTGGPPTRTAVTLRALRPEKPRHGQAVRAWHDGPGRPRRAPGCRARKFTQQSSSSSRRLGSCGVLYAAPTLARDRSATTKVRFAVARSCRTQRRDRMRRNGDETRQKNGCRRDPRESGPVTNVC